jgi:hypothetical protein
MTIKAKTAFLTYIGTTPIVARKGQILGLPEELAKSLVNAELAEFVEPIKEEKKAIRKPTTRKAAKIEK